MTPEEAKTYLKKQIEAARAEVFCGRGLKITTPAGIVFIFGPAGLFEVTFKRE